MDKRTILATLICMGILVLWMVLSPKFFPQAPPAAPKKAAPPPAEVKPPAGTPPGPGVTPEVKPEARPVEFAVQPPIPVETEHFKLEFTNQGAGIQKLILRYPDATHEVDLLLPRESAFPHFAIRHVDGPDKIENIPWKVEERKGDELAAFSYPLRNGVVIKKTFRLKDTYTLGMSVELDPPKAEEGKPPAERVVQLELYAFNGLEHESPYRYEQYFKGVALVGGNPRYWELGGVAKGEEKLAEAGKMPAGADRDEKIRDGRKALVLTDTPRRWLGLKNRFFAALLLPDSEAEGKIESYFFRAASADAVKDAKGLKNLYAQLKTAPIKLSDKPVLLSFSAYAGPIQKDALQQMAHAPMLLTYGAGCIIPSGIIDLVGSVILGILKFFAHLLGNWGAGIIATTLLIRICIFPLSKKSQESAYKMQQLGPKIQVLRERYKDDKQKFGMEQMRLFKENKINPLSGCLPLILQLPIFVGMFSVFDTSIELRGERFLLWISDLSRPDRLIRWETPVDVFFLPTLDSLNLLPIVMTITWFLQAYFAPRSPDPQMQQQQKMMMAMPIVFGLMCYNYASGLSLYFLVNSLLAMIEQKVIKKYILKIGRDGQGTGGQGSPASAG